MNGFYIIEKSRVTDGFSVEPAGPVNAGVRYEAHKEFDLPCYSNPIPKPGGLVQFQTPKIQGDEIFFVDLKVTRLSSYNGLPDRIPGWFGDLVSKECKEVIQEIDPDSGHQFREANVFLDNGEKLKEQYYWFICGVIVWEKESIKTMDAVSKGQFIPHTREGLGRIHQRFMTNLERANYVSELPFWSMLTDQLHPMFASVAAIESLWKHGISGFKKYSDEMYWADELPSGTEVHSVFKVQF